MVFFASQASRDYIKDLTEQRKVCITQVSLTSNRPPVREAERDGLQMQGGVTGQEVSISVVSNT